MEKHRWPGAAQFEVRQPCADACGLLASSLGHIAEITTKNVAASDGSTKASGRFDFKRGAVALLMDWWAFVQSAFAKDSIITVGTRSKALGRCLKAFCVDVLFGIFRCTECRNHTPTEVAHSKNIKRSTMITFMNAIRVGTSILSTATVLPTYAFYEDKVPDGLYYNGTNVNQQIWTPLVLAQGGKLIDPLLYAQAKGIKALEGQGRTTYLHANTTFLYGGCRTDTKLQSVQPLIAKVPTVYVGDFVGKDCERDQTNVLENFHVPRDQQGSNPMPTLFVKPLRPEALPLWVYGVPGILVGKNVPIRAWSQSELGGTPETINGVISRSHFVTLPVLEPDELRIARLEKRPSPKYDVNLGEAAHRSSDIVVTPQLNQTTTAFLKEKLWPRYYPRLESALAQRFGGTNKSYFELGLMQGVDIDNTRAFDYMGVARIGIVTKAGPWRWVDVVWCWRSGLGQSDEALQVLRTSEDALYEPANNYFSSKNPAIWSPNLVVSGFADFDKDKRMEVISTLVRPMGMAYDKVGAASGYDLWLRDSAIHAWQPEDGDARKGTWQTVFKSAVHEERIVTLNPEQINIEIFGE